MEPLAVLVDLAALLVSCLLGWPVAVLVLRLSRAPTHQRPQTTTHGGRAVPILERRVEAPRVPGDVLLRGGRWVGLLERLAVTACILARQPELIAIVVAIKGLARYPELREFIGASERFLVGTFASLLWAVAVGVIGLAVRGAL